MELDLVKVLRKGADSPEVREVARAFAPLEVQNSPPFRRYFCFKKTGLSLLLENDIVITVQLYVKPTKQFSAYTGILPFGIKPGMGSGEVHKLLGKPVESDEFDSKFDIVDEGVRLVVLYDGVGGVRVVSISLLETWAGNPPKT